VGTDRVKPEFSVVTFKWKPKGEYRSTFGPETVNTLFSMVRRHFPVPFRAICVTDDPAGIDPDIEIVPLWDDFADLENPSGPLNPSCYRRLRMFAPSAGKMFGPRFVSLDLDVVIVGDMRPLWLRPEPFVIWGDTNPTTPYNGSMMLMTAGARARVWTDFHPVESPKRAQALGYFGSDQAWIGACLGHGEAMWTHRDGVYSYRNQIGVHRQDLPPNAKVVFFHGQHDPWGPRPQQQVWVRENYR
jgi:hypothetical protein